MVQVITDHRECGTLLNDTAQNFGSSLALLLMRREMRAISRGRFFYVKRVVPPLAGAMIAVFGLLGSALANDSAIGLRVFRWLASVTLPFSIVIGVILGGNALMREKAEQTIGLLALTDLTRLCQMTGRTLAAIFTSAAFLLSLLPLFALCPSFGGITAGQVFAGLLVIFATTFLVTGLGLMLAAHARSERAFNMMAFSGAVLLILFMRVLPDAAEILPGMNASAAAMFSPWRVMDQVVNSGVLSATGPYCGLCMAGGCGMILLASAILSRRALDEDAGAAEKAGWPRRGLAGRAWFKTPDLHGNPMVWREVNFAYRGMKTESLLATGGLVLAAAVASVAVLLGRPEDAGDLVSGVFAGAAALFTLTFMVLCGVRAAGAFERERRNRTLEVLMTTHLREKDVVHGKMLGILKTTLPWLAGAAVCTAPPSLYWMHGEDGSVYTAIMFMMFAAGAALGMAFSFAAVALYLSLIFRLPVTLLASFAGAVVWNSCAKNVITSPLVIIMSAVMSNSAGMAGTMVGFLVFGVSLGTSVLCDLAVGVFFIGLARSRLRARNY